MSVIRKTGRIFDVVLNIGAALAGALLIAVMLMVTVKIIFRYVLGEGLIGVDQISGTLLLYITFLGAAWVLRREEHVSIDLLINFLNPRMRRWFGIVTSIIGASVCLILTIYATQEVISSWQKGIRIPAEIEIPRVVNLGVIPLGCLLLFIQFLRRTGRFVSGRGLHRNGGEG